MSDQADATFEGRAVSAVSRANRARKNQGEQAQAESDFQMAAAQIYALLELADAVRSSGTPGESTPS